MTKRLNLRRETLIDLTTAELEQLAGAAGVTTNCPQLTIGSSCGIVCHESVGLTCTTG